MRYGIHTAAHDELAAMTAQRDKLAEALLALSKEWVNGRNVLDGCTKTVADQVREVLTVCGLSDQEGK